MGWYPTIDLDTLNQNLTDEFWLDLLNHLKQIRNNQLKQIDDCGGFDDWLDLPYEDRIFLPDNLSEDYENIEELKDNAFCSDHMEHIAAWLWDKNLHPIFQKHKINGQYVINHNSGDGGYAGIEFVDGVAFDVEVTTVVVRGAKL